MFNLFRRIGNLFRGFFSLFVSNSEDANPKAMLANEVDKYNLAVANYNQSLGKSQGLSNRLKMQIATATAELAKAKAAMLSANAAGLTDRAGQYAMTVKRLQSEITENQSQWDHSEEAYKLQTRQRDVFVKEARERIERVKGKISKAEMLESQADLAKMISVQVFDTSGSGLSKIEASLDERAANAEGITRVATDALASSTFLTTEAEQKALEQATLAEMLGLPVEAHIVQPATPALAAPAASNADLSALLTPNTTSVQA